MPEDQERDETVPKLPGILAVTGDARLKDGERRTVTVLFSDMKGFTALSERTDPEEMDSLMTRVFARFEGIIRKHGGYVEKYIGDALVAVFGAPELHEDDTARAIDSALEFNALMRRPPEGLPAGLQFRTGIHTGLVTTGRRGSFDVVTGHTLAVASRLQVAAPPNGVLVSEAARELCERLYVFSDAMELSLKGKDERVLAYQALARRKALFDYATPFVDRKQPLETLTAEYVRHMRGEPRAVYIVGDGGMGKTRIVAEFWARLKAFPDFNSTFLAVNPSLFGSFDYAAVLHAVVDFLDLRPDSSFEEYATVVRERTRLDESFLRDTYGLFRPSERVAGESRFAAALTALFDAILSSDGNVYPDVIFVDNAGAADERSLEFFRGYFATSAAKPFAVLCDRVPDERAAAVFNVGARLSLEPLSAEDASALARALDPGGLDDAAVALVVERSQGYPLFIEEYVKLIRKSRDMASMPGTIQTTILAGLDRLDPEARALAQRLSILRYPFTTEFAAALHGRAEGDPDAVPACLERLATERILARTGEGGWAFKHAIVREAIYDSLLLHNRRLLHGLAAELMRGEQRAKPAAVFAHLAEAEAWEAARDYLVRERPPLPVDSVPLIERLIAHCPPEATGELIELLFIKYAAFYNNKHYEGLAPIVHEMYRLALRSRNRFYLARCYHLLMTTCYMELDYHSAVLFGRKALDAYAGGANQKGAANARFFLANCLMGMGDFARAAEVMAGLDRTDPYADLLFTAASSTFRFRQGDYREATALNAELVTRAEASGEEDEACRFRSYRVINVIYDFGFEDMAHAEKAERLYCSYDSENAVHYHAAMAVARRLAGDGDAAARIFAAADYHLAQLRRDRERSSAGAALAWARHLAGDRAEAREQALRALEASVRAHDYASMFNADVLLAELCLADADRDAFAFYVLDASLLSEAPIYRSRATMARYWYLAWVLIQSTPGTDLRDGRLRAEDMDDYLAESKRLLEAELEAMPDDRARETALSLSVFGRISRA